MKHVLQTFAAASALALAAVGPVACECEPRGREEPQSEPPAVTPLLADAGGHGCPHPLMPLVAGATWTYKVSSSPTKSPGIAELKVLELTTKGRATIAKVSKKVGPREVVVEAICNTEGVSFLPMFVYLGPPLTSSISYAPRVTKRSNALIPPVSKLRLGAEWTSSLEAHTEQPGGKALTLDSIWQVEASYLGEEEVTVPAGRFKARQVKLHVTGHHRPPAEKEVVFSETMSDPPPMTFTYSLAPGVGVVLIESEPLEDRPQIRPRWELTGLSRQD